ncbi:LEA type 2 family protein [Geobacter sp. FeAm09]|uniref:LEA type 2 family protein n=1 Tax=Geobacter sp. FeAm09 TaxID=2597769 RepID=UPI0011EE6353|nr:LEA type 2 family protein [Geobacter sp. FeAm09]QEM67810.1 LEA type 2 family protein [Geobacter sp. FeAm09]
MGRLIILFILVFHLTACAALVTPPQVALKHTNLVALDTAGFDVECHLGVTNPNSFDISLRGYSYDLQVMALPLAAGGLQQTVVFPAGRETDLRLPVRIRYHDLIEILKRLPAPDRIPYRLDARLHLDTPLGEMVIPVTSDDTLSLPEAYRPGTYLNRIGDILKGVR